MPLIRAAAPEPTPAPPAQDAQLVELAAGDSQARRRAAQSLAVQGAQPGADAGRIAAALAAQLRAEPELSVREAILVALGTLGGHEVAALLAPLLGAADASLRNGALEALKRLHHDAVTAVDGLLADPDPDLRLLAAEVMRGWGSDMAAPRLARLLMGEAHVNVCAAALDIAAAIGEPGLMPALATCKSRFAGQGFIEFAADVAIDRARQASLPTAPAIPPRPKRRVEAKPKKPAHRNTEPGS